MKLQQYHDSQSAPVAIKGPSQQRHHALQRLALTTPASVHSDGCGATFVTDAGW